MDRRKFLSSLAIAPIAGAAILRADPAEAGTFLYYETSGIVEPAIPVTFGNQTVWRRIYALQLPELFAGDVLDVAGEFQYQNNLGYNVEMVSQISLTPGPTPSEWADLFDYPSSADYVARPAGENVNSERHYYQLTRAAHYKVPGSLPSSWLLMRARCRSSLATGAAITVPFGYGKLSCTIHRPS